MRLELEKCVLRSWRKSDAAEVARYADNRQIWLQVRDRLPHPYHLADAQAYLARALAAEVETEFAITRNDLPIGGIGLTLHDDIERISAELGYLLSEAHWGQGIASSAVAGFTAWAFAELPLERIYALPFARNRASCRVLEKCGYLREGHLRRSVIKAGEILDQFLYATWRPCP